MQLTLLFALAVAVLTTATLASPVQSTRDGVKCQRKYVGHMYAVRLEEGSNGDKVGYPNDSVTYGNDAQHTLSIDKGLNQDNPQLFQFDECTTADWNPDDPPRQYGQVKPLSLADATECVTAVNKSDPATGANRLYVDLCGSFNGGIQQTQWYYANYIQSREDTGPFVVLTLIGNPNDPNTLPAVAEVGGSNVPGAIGLKKNKGSSPVVLALFDVQIVS